TSYLVSPYTQLLCFIILHTTSATTNIHPLSLHDALPISLRRDVKYCKVCHNICDDNMCSICADHQRDHSTVCVVENIKEVMAIRSEEHTSELQSRFDLVCRLLLETKNTTSI